MVRDDVVKALMCSYKTALLTSDIQYLPLVHVQGTRWIQSKTYTAVVFTVVGYIYIVYCQVYVYLPS